MLGLFERAKADVALLRNERSTGKPLSLLGYPEEARAVAADLAEQIRAAKPKVLVTTSPSDYDAFRTDFPAMGIDLAGIEILHATQCIDRMLAKGRLAPREDASGVVTFLDDTYLGRSYGLFDEPRRILGAVAGLELREMSWTRELAHSCGEPGGIFQQVQPELSQRLAARVLNEAAATGADTLVTTCPAALSILQQANQTDLALKDIVEMV
jgi:Fe-S oxidoreductase